MTAELRASIRTRSSRQVEGVRMARPIELQSTHQEKADPRGTSLRTIHLLPGAIEGVTTNYYLLEKGTGFLPTRHAHRGHVLLLIRGVGKVEAGDTVFSFCEMAALVAPGTGGIEVRATSEPVECLEILMDLQEHEAAALQATAPFFVLYSQCELYSEAIKSSKTISRTIVPAGRIARFCMGSVETVGPDRVGAHSHPMLEQLFFGLRANACVVTADDNEAVFGQGMLLHIPPGAWHGVRVEDGQTLHYVWMDFFRREQDLTYIREQHKPIQRNSSTVS